MTDVDAAIADLLGVQPSGADAKAPSGAALSGIGALAAVGGAQKEVSPIDAAIADLTSPVGSLAAAATPQQPTATPTAPVIDPESGQLMVGSANPDDLHGSVLNSPIGGFIRGIRDPVDALAQLASRGIKAVAPAGAIGDWADKNLQNVEAINKGAEADYEQNWRGGAPPSFDTGRILGNVALSAPLIAATSPAAGAGAGLLARLGYGAATGAAANALMSPVQNPGDNYWEQKRNQLLLGGALGAAPPAVGAGLARVVSPNVSENIQRLMDIGVNPTPGQMMGGGLNRAEEGLGSIPFAGDFIRAGRGGAIQEYNRGVINRALSPIGQTLDSGTAIGRDAIDEMQRKISANLDQFKTIPQVASQDGQFATEMSGLTNGTNLPLSLPPERLTQLNGILNSKLLSRFEPDGTMTGENFQRATSDLGAEARSLMHHGNDSDQRALGLAVQDAQVNLRDLLDRTAPDPAIAQAAKANNAAYAAMLRVQGAAGAQGAEEGIFSPAQLSASVRAFDPTKGKRAFASGNALMQDLSDAGKAVLGNKVPDSGTALRSMMTYGVPAAAGMMFGHGGINLPDLALALGGAGAAASLYSTPARSALARLMAVRPPGAQGVANTIKEIAPYGSALLGRGVPGLGI